MKTGKQKFNGDEFMRITFLGSSHGVPEANQRCTCTMVEVGGRYYLIDVGVMVIEDLRTRGIPVDAVKGIFITHMHGDHTNGLLSFADLISWYFKTADPEIFLPKAEAKGAIQAWLTVNGYKPRELRYREVHEGLIFDDGYLKVTAIRTRHCDVSYAYLLEAEGKTVLMTGDLNKDPKTDFPAVDKDLDLLVGEAAHFSATVYADLLSGRRVKAVIIHHTAPWNIPNIGKLSEALADIPVTMANDGLEITI